MVKGPRLSLLVEVADYCYPRLKSTHVTDAARMPCCRLTRGHVVRLVAACAGVQSSCHDCDTRVRLSIEDGVRSERVPGEKHSRLRLLVPRDGCRRRVQQCGDRRGLLSPAKLESLKAGAAMGCFSN